MVKSKDLVEGDIILFKNYKGWKGYLLESGSKEWGIGKIIKIVNGGIKCGIIDSEKCLKKEFQGEKYNVIDREIECILEPNVLGRF